MDFKDQLKQLADRIDKLKESLQTEEATKNALIMPFLQAMGYDVFNPLEVMPEFTCDIGTKKGEKIDYAIFKDGAPVVLIECKHWKQPLTLHDNQLLRYYHVSPAKFGILTNGINYRFYTDLETPNKMDETPFLEVDLSDMKGNQIEELKKFCKAYFDVENIMTSASELKYTNELRSILMREFASPSSELVKLWAKQVYDGTITAKVLEQFTTLVRKSIANYVNDAIAERLQTALKSAEPEVQTETVISVPEVSESKIETTAEELEAFYIVKSILRSAIPAERITYRDAQNYFTIILDDSNRKLVCRLYLNSPTNKMIAFIGDDKKEIRYKIASIDEIYGQAEQIIGAAQRYT
ncbi:hypothetical protein FACS1894159_09220 [Bacteroidia bacterium]|nr:hypothetical protein FACS1894159_09220 [Bacteroidia bacterium]